MIERGELRRVRDSLALARPDGPPVSGCLDIATIASLAEGTLSLSSRPAAMAHLAECWDCRRAVASVAAVLADGSVAREASALERRGRSRRMRIAIPLAAAAALLLAVGLPRLQRPSATHRSPGIAPVMAPVPRAPLGTVAAADTLRWSSVAGVDVFRVTLFDNAGTVRYQGQVSDTGVALPDSVRLTSGQVYLWKVDARAGWDRWVPSELVRFQIREPKQ